MDIATLLGLAGAFGLIIWSMLQGGTLAAYTNIPGLAIVLGGSIMVVLLRSSLYQIMIRVAAIARASHYWICGEAQRGYLSKLSRRSKRPVCTTPSFVSP